MNGYQLQDVADRLAQRRLDQPVELYEFGVLTGDSIVHMDRLLAERNVPRGKVWGFDSFCGLPVEQEGLPRWPEFRPGFFDVRQEFKLDTIENVMEYARLKFNDDLRKRFTFIPGFFEQSLTASLRTEKGMAPADWVYMDADLYISTYQALTWLAENGLLQAGRTLISYDEWNSARGGGEEKAHNDIAQRYGLLFEEVWSGNNGLEQKTFLFQGREMKE